MSHLSITPNIELNPWIDLAGKEPTHGIVDRIGLMPQGMASGKAAVMMHALDDNGGDVIVELSLAMFRLAFAALSASPVAQLEDL